jgi:hypothetical protein
MIATRGGVFPAMVRSEHEPEVNFRLRMNTGRVLAAEAENPQGSAKKRVVTKADHRLNRAFSLFVNTLATNAA